ncbi:MAG: hypothetical protein IIY02_06305 [Firmicutes bacterium]|nr:hypothetical protein [Bacillota bacterium]
MNRIVEAYIGEYASGKSENAVNRALSLAEQGRKVTLVDLDLVEPVYTLRPLIELLEEKGVHVIAWKTEETIGLGEAGSVLHPAMRWALRNEGDVILDIGYGAKGSAVLNLLEGIEDEKDLKVILVVNTLRPMTDSVEKIIEYLDETVPAHGFIANTHLGEQTTVPLMLDGLDMVMEAAQKADLPVYAMAVDERFKEDFPEDTVKGVPLRFLRRYLPLGFW